MGEIKGYMGCEGLDGNAQAVEESTVSCYSKGKKVYSRQIFNFKINSRKLEFLFEISRFLNVGIQSNFLKLCNPN